MKKIRTLGDSTKICIVCRTGLDDKGKCLCDNISCPFTEDGIKCDFVTNDLLTYYNHIEKHEEKIRQEWNRSNEC